jgi:hypothetical protein
MVPRRMRHVSATPVAFDTRNLRQWAVPRPMPQTSSRSLFIEPSRHAVDTADTEEAASQKPTAVAVRRG